MSKENILFLLEMEQEYIDRNASIFTGKDRATQISQEYGYLCGIAAMVAYEGLSHDDTMDVLERITVMKDELLDKIASGD